MSSVVSSLASRADDAEEVSAYVLSRVKRAAGPRWAQGRHAPPLPLSAGGEALRTMAETRLWRVPNHVAEGLVAWARGERDVVVRHDVPPWRDLLALQARGWRCVSLLPDGSKEDGLDFALHDLCHLEKFVERAHFAEQKGFFRSLERALSDPRWDAFDARYDEAWRKDLEHVGADMNGSAIFLFAALKMKLKMAVRRELAAREGRPPPTGGPLGEGELAAFRGALAELLELLGLVGPVADDARAVTTKHDAKDAAERLAAYFDALGVA